MHNDVCCALFEPDSRGSGWRNPRVRRGNYVKYPLSRPMHYSSGKAEVLATVLRLVKRTVGAVEGAAGGIEGTQFGRAA